MKNQINQVARFNEAFGQKIAIQPTNISPEEAELRFNLQQEELDEYKQATQEGNIVEILDSLVDQAYILCGTILQHGLQDVFEEAFNLVHQNNMSKLGEDGKPILREDGKILKPEGYVPVDLSKVFEVKVEEKQSLEEKIKRYIEEFGISPTFMEFMEHQFNSNLQKDIALMERYFYRSKTEYPLTSIVLKDFQKKDAESLRDSGQL